MDWTFDEEVVQISMCDFLLPKGPSVLVSDGQSKVC